MGFPRHRAAASLKRCLGQVGLAPAAEFSAASGRGLIEATAPAEPCSQPATFSAASGRGLIEARNRLARLPARLRFPRHRAAASLKRSWDRSPFRAILGFPRHRAAASLKQDPVGLHLRRGRGFPRHRAAASLKRGHGRGGRSQPRRVFRGIGPRPH